MSAGGKGSAPRPFSVNQKTYFDNWDAIFGKKPHYEPDDGPLSDDQLHKLKQHVNSQQMTPQEITDYKNKWKQNSINVEVHSDLAVKCKDWCRKHLDRWQWSMDTYTDVYAHTFRFELLDHATAFAEEFKEWGSIIKGTP